MNVEIRELELEEIEVVSGGWAPRFPRLADPMYWASLDDAGPLDGLPRSWGNIPTVSIP